ncbi:MAG TPA: hypothetical protein VFK19_10780 [Sphingomicrobium sp.]|nr:hypothetical protein [Sphingomicrobium sp.]
MNGMVRRRDVGEWPACLSVARPSDSRILVPALRAHVAVSIVAGSVQAIDPGLHESVGSATACSIVCAD